MRLTTRTNLAMRTLMYCAVNPDMTVRKSDIAEACNASLNHLGLVINMLAQAGYLDTTRGRNGGLRLAMPASEISVGRVCRLLEANVPFAECFPGAENTCPIKDCCRLRGVFGDALRAFYEHLDRVTVHDLTRNNEALTELLALEAV